MNVHTLYERRVLRKATVIIDDNSDVLAKHELLPSGRRFRVPKSNTVNSISEQINPVSYTHLTLPTIDDV